MAITTGKTVDPQIAAAAPRTGGATRERVDYIEAFRGIAILLIIAGHAFDLAWTRAGRENVVDSRTTLAIISALLTGGTFYFVFISGFLYRHVFYGRMPFGAFMQKKVVQVGIPYLVLGSALAVFQIVANDFHVVLWKHGAVHGENPYVDFAVLIATGNMMTAYWYIPFIFVVFLASPLFDRFIRLPAPAKFAILAASIAVAFWVHRPYESLDPIHSFLYFTNIYLFGILCCEYRHMVMPILKRVPVLLALGLSMVLVAGVEELVFHRVGDLERTVAEGWMPLAFDMMIVQKYIGVLFFCGLLARFARHVPLALTHIAEISFGLYFMHGIVLMVMSKAPAGLSPHTGSAVLDFTLYALVSIAASFAAVTIIRWLAGARSRMLIGS